ncbi:MULTISPECIES: hypothetical protein [Streptomyces]|uniref:hypothetical protein n=1 Tax=Streptomyces TaxID=1883 RepID=UPI001E4F3405|nr:MULTISPECIES: hypothetical protein [Streptomyces]UFQ16409.1 hypothetical protein J2N69_16150 [Streptomyces huasconensis]WCL86012.1 hypothetical protein PPN52_16155 [Streptomyces sp. JCM 35825]
MPAFKLVIHRGWERPIFQSGEMQMAVSQHTADVMKLAIAGAPRSSPAKPHFNEIQKNIGMAINRDHTGWWGNVTVETHPRVRHAMLQERGWTDRAGRRHPGRRYLKEALLRARVE